MRHLPLYVFSKRAFNILIFTKTCYTYYYMNKNTVPIKNNGILVKKSCFND